MMLTTILVIVQALTFSVTVGRNTQNVTLRYPVADKVAWIEVCVEVNGYAREERIQQTSCWGPRFKVEEYQLPVWATTIRGILEISEDGYRSILRTPVIQVRPES